MIGKYALFEWYVFLIGLIIPSCSGYEMNHCYCWNEMNDTLREKVSEFQSPPIPPEYNYIGVKPRAGAAFEHCFCSDVLRMNSDLEINDESFFNRTQMSNSDYEKQEKNITKTLEKLLEIEEATGDYLSTKVTFSGLETSPTTVWKVEITVKGQETVTPYQMTDLLKEKTDNGDGSYSLEGIGQISDKISFKAIVCTENPASASSNGQRLWQDTQKYPGDRASYSCDSGYFIVEESLAYSECLHDNLTWSTPLVNIECKQGCQDTPPDRPFFSTWNWESSLRVEGSTAVYYCMRGYKSISGQNGSSMCTNSRWSAVEDDYECIQILCPIAIPQVPAHGRSDFDKSVRFIDTQIYYNCKKGYSATIAGDIRVRCTSEGVWTKLPDGYDCINDAAAIRSGLYQHSSVSNYDYYEDGPTPKALMVERNWFWVVTLPTIFALMLTIFLCLVCTRPDSPLFILCTGNAKKVAYILA